MIFYQILIILLIVAIKGIFSAADTAFTYMNRAEIIQLSKKDKKARKIRILMEDSNKFFGIIEVGINMCELISSAVASITIVNHLTFLIEKIPIPANLAIILSSLVITVLLSYVLLVFGGVLPKKIARNYPKRTAFQLINILWVIAKLNYPFERLIHHSNRIFSKILKMKDEPQEKMTEKQLKMILTEAKEEGVLANIEKRFLFNAIKVNDISVQKIMVPRENIDAISIEESFEKVLNNIGKYQFTRIPVYEGDFNHIIGIFNIKDIAIEYAKTKTVKNDLKSFLREVKFINKDEKLFSAFKKMQKNNQVMAVVVDDNNIPLGIISIEDILEKLVGKIFDEHDKKQDKITSIKKKG